MLLKLSRKERSIYPGIMAFNDNVKGTEELLNREREGWLIDYNQWDHSRSPKMLSISLVYIHMHGITLIHTISFYRDIPR